MELVSWFFSANKQITKAGPNVSIDLHTCEIVATKQTNNKNELHYINYDCADFNCSQFICYICNAEKNAQPNDIFMS